MSARPMKIILRRGDVTLTTLEMTGGCEPVFVGRSHDCALRVPSDEHSVSGTHARLFWEGSKLFIEDAGSRNGIFHDGVQVVKPRRMNCGDTFSLGNCQIAVGERERDRKSSVRKHHRLEFLNGDRLGQTVDIVPKPGTDAFAIGLDPGCDVNLPDMLVSRHHAYLKVRESGECWIEDAGSRNGTFVNGEKLGVKERLLKHGDKISIAYFDFRFLDRNVSVTRVHAWVKLAVVAVTLCVMAAAYVIWRAAQVSVEDYEETVRQYAAAEDFPSARKALELAFSTRDAGSHQVQLDALASQVELWESTCTDWAQVRKDIAAGRFDDANEALNRLQAVPLEGWAWKPDDVATMRREVEFVSKTLRLYFDGRAAINAAADGIQTDANASVRSVSGPIEEFLEKGAKAGARFVYAKPMLVKLEELTRELTAIRKGFDAVDANLEKGSPHDLDFGELLAVFTRIAEDAKMLPAVRGYAGRQLEPCRQFLAAQQFIGKEIELLTAMNFADVAKMENALKLPKAELCVHQAKFSDARAALLAQHEAVQREAASIRMIVDGLRESGVTPDSRGAAVEAFVTAANWRKALAFDCLKKRPPSVRRNEPTSYYDEMLGIEFTYESIRAMPNVYSGRGTRMVGFTPKCITARLAFEKAETFVQYMDGKDRKYLQKGELGRFYTMCVKIAISREEMVSVLKEIKGTKRQKLVASFFAEYFTARPSYSAKQAIASQFAALKREVMELGDEYSNAGDPEKQILLRNKILEAGLPGDPILHTKWVQVFN